MERRTVQELVTRYEFEPNLKDIYVEGPDDKAIIEGMLVENHVAGVSVFEISSVHVPSNHGEENSSRTRLIKLARLLSEALDVGSLKVTCVVDSDFDHLAGHTEHNTLLLTTDYANMEVYFLSEDVLQRVSRSCLRRWRLTHYMIDHFMVPSLQRLFLIRYVNSQQEWRLRYLSFERLLTYRRGRFGLDRMAYLQRYLNTNGRIGELDEFVQAVDRVVIPCGLDARCFIHGHDFVLLLRRMLNHLRGRNVYGNDEVVMSVLRASADYTSLAEEPLFAEIIRRFRGEPNQGMDHEQ